MCNAYVLRTGSVATDVTRFSKSPKGLLRVSAGVAFGLLPVRRGVAV